MSVINSVLLDVIGLAQINGLYCDIVIGSMPPDNGISIAIGAGGPSTTFLTKGMAYEIYCVINGKNTDAQTVSDALNDIHQALTQTKTYPTGATYQITDIETVATPAYSGREENSQWLYSSSVRVKFFYFDEPKGDNA